MKFAKITALFLIILVIAACKKDVGYLVTKSTSTTSNSGTGFGSTGNTSSTGTYYFTGTLAGTALSWQGTDDFSGWVTGSSSSFSSAQGVSTGSITALFSASTNSFKPQLGVEFRTVNYSYTQDKSAYFKGFLSTGAIAFAADNLFIIGTKSLAIHYTDAQGKEYTSVGSQTGTGNIASVTYLAAQLGTNENLKIKLTFNCTLYPTDGIGNSLTLSNAEATVRLENLIN